MEFLIIPLVVWFLSQTAKVIVRFIASKGHITIRDISWIYFWGGGFPSSHMAVFSSFSYLVWRYEGVSPLFAFTVVVMLISAYNLLSERKKEGLFEEYAERGPNPLFRNIASRWQLLDISGHTFFEIGVGILFGVLSGYLLDILFL